ncbi:MAG: hypothetical protein RBS80_31345 [Thermoguttaceae bacterium]|jgi:hypothetical protein|nr:hypothetical protein [Thermoguttaceae bacterium]
MGKRKLTPEETRAYRALARAARRLREAQERAEQERAEETRPAKRRAKNNGGRKGVTR